MSAGYGPAEADHQEEEDAEGVASGLTLLAHSLAGLSAQLGQRPDCFSVGPVARVLGKFFCSRR